ncbi:uncharacterized protein CDV56_107382 [Aspergillus thermomutatus]|uniref:Uncharacterized protein n=1 Tax=Aspergillus thermomutatus TaxID=41047 RepID=A0A397H5C0_ASPTH|nr:uncharacterized protein CDV56_107382 [Aspergillus thermomutatus]RHZ56603.1 hypothetical protein CDV56_107382 [Aspergillus thermomutatus]
MTDMARLVRHWPGGIAFPAVSDPITRAICPLIRSRKRSRRGSSLFKRAGCRVGAPPSPSSITMMNMNCANGEPSSSTNLPGVVIHDRAPIGLPGTEGERSYSEPEEGLRYPAEALERILDTHQPCDANGVMSLVPVDVKNPINWARWVKFIILLYRYDMEVGHCLESTYMPSEAVVNPVTTSTGTLSIEDFPAWLNLEVALFGSVYLTRTGTVIYLGNPGPYALVDEDGLQTGRLALTVFTNTGAIEDSVLIRPFNMQEPHMRYSTLGKGLDDVKHSKGGYRHQNPPYASLCAFSLLFLPRVRWKEDVELYAPGYLALEAVGKGGEYNLNDLVSPDVIGCYNKPRVWEKLRSGADPRFMF